MRKFDIRSMRGTDDYSAVAPLLNLVWSEPTTAERLQAEEDSIPPGKLHYEEGKLMGWDRPKWVAEDEQGRIAAYAIAWRAPWTEPGALICTLVVHPDSRRQGVGRGLYDAMHAWSKEIRASRLIASVRETDVQTLGFAERRGWTRERHMFESALDLSSFDGETLSGSIREVEQGGIRFVTLADEPGEANERKLHELYRLTHLDIPGFNEDFPWFEEWRKWSIGLPGVRPE